MYFFFKGEREKKDRGNNEKVPEFNGRAVEMTLIIVDSENVKR